MDLHVEESGTGDAVLLLHSSGMSGRQWRRLVPELVRRSLRAVVPDFTGHGASEPWLEPKPFSFRTDVLRTVALLEQLEGGGPAHVVGHSYGGLVALQAALAAPDRIRSLTLFDPVSFGVLDPSADAAVIAGFSQVDLPWGSAPADHERWLQAFVDYWGGPGAWVHLREEARAEFRRVGWVVREGVRSLMADTTPASVYAGLRCAVHLMTGAESPPAAKAVIRHLGLAFRTARTTTLPGAGHLGPLTHPDPFKTALLAALVPESLPDA
jgi:pimeloyl-ACP methyl ester carboxylesterase